jgi:hypothetical protein
MKYVDADEAGEVYQVKVSPKDSPDVFKPVPRIVKENSDTFESLAGTNDPILGTVTKEDLLDFLFTGWATARRSKVIGSSNLPKRIANLAKRMVEVSVANGNPISQEQAYEQLRALGIS